MDVTVTRRYRGKKDFKGNIESGYSFKSKEAFSAASSAILKSGTITEGDNDLDKTKMNTFAVCLNFIDLIPFKYKAPDDLRINEQFSEVADATLAFDLEEYELGGLLAQFDELIITPADLGCVILTGVMVDWGFSTFSYPNFFQYIEVRKIPQIELGKISPVTDRAVSVTFTKPFSAVPVGRLKVYRMRQASAGKWKEWDVLYYHTSQDWLTTEGFSLQIETTENLTGIIIEYEFKEI